MIMIDSCGTVYWPIDSQPSCPGLHDLRIASLNTLYNMKAISLHYNITDQLSDYIGDGDSDLHRHDWQVNTIVGPTKLVRQDAIVGGLSIGQLYLLLYLQHTPKVCVFKKVASK